MIYFEDINKAKFTRDWFMYGVKPMQKMITIGVNGEKYEYKLSNSWDLSTASYTDITEQGIAQ